MTSLQLTGTWRRLRRERLYSFITAAGLAIGLLTCILALLYARWEWSYDRFHDKSDRISRVIISSTDDVIATTAGPAGAAIVEDYPAFTESVRLFPSPMVVRSGERAFREEGVFFADPSFLAVFDFPLVSGDPATALEGPGQVLITEATAAKYFPEGDPVGKSLSLGGRDAEVTGVLADLPTNSHLQFEVIGSMGTVFDAGSTSNWFWNPFYTYVLADGPMAEAADLETLVSRRVGPEATIALQLQPLTDIHLNPATINEVPTGSNAAYVLVALAIAAAIFLIALFNYVNLTTASLSRRSREIGVRQATGATRGDLVRQFIGEAVLLNGIAFVVVLIALPPAIVAMNDLLGIGVNPNVFGDPVAFGTAIALALGLGALSGLYPALVAAKASPAEMARARGGGNAFVRQGLIAFQFVISATLLICTVVLLRQLAFIEDADLGFDDTAMIVLPLYGESTSQAAVLRDEIAALPGITSATAASSLPGHEGRTLTQVDFETDEGMQKSGMLTVAVDANFVAALDIGTESGQAITSPLSVDETSGFMINEAAERDLMAEYGWDSAVGKRAAWLYSTGGWELDGRKEGQILAVLDDVNFEPLQRAVEPVIYHVWPTDYRYVAARVAPGSEATAMAGVRSVWERVLPDVPFESSYLADDVEALYTAERRTARLLLGLTLISIFLSCLGLFGLTTFTAERRSREIGVRKALGASVPQVVGLLVRDLTAPLVIAALAAIPLALLASQAWLDNFAYRVAVGPGTVALGLTIALAIALSATAAQSWRAARLDPTQTLRQT